MRLSELMGKEVINLHDGVRLGSIEDGELVFDIHTGKIRTLLVPEKGIFSFFSRGRLTTIPFPAIRRIGEDFIIVDMEANHQPEADAVFWPKRILKNFQKED